MPAVLSVAVVFLVVCILSPIQASTGEQEHIYQYWDFNGEKAWNLDIRIEVQAASDGKFVAQTFDFDTGGGGYMGLQQKATDGSRVAIFSMWKDGLFGSTIIFPDGHSNCQRDPGNENGGGTQCFLDFHWDVQKKYTLRLWRLSTTATRDQWSAYVLDHGNEHQIGTIQLEKPSGQQSRVGATSTFLEDFNNIQDCQSPIPFTVRVWRPSLNNGAIRLGGSGNNGGSTCANGHVSPNAQSTQWTMNIGTGPIRLVGHGGQCLTLPGNSRKDGVNLVMSTCSNAATPDPSQNWIVDGDEIRLYGSNYCVDVEGPSPNNMTPVQIWSCLNIANQKWTFRANGQVLGFANKCLDVQWGGQSPGTPVQIWACQTHWSQMSSQTWFRQEV